MFGVGLVMFVVAIGMAYVYYKKFGGGGAALDSLEKRNELAAKKAAELRAAHQPKELSLLNVRPGGVIKLDGVGLEMQSMDLQVTERHLLKEGTDRWYELTATDGKRNIYLSLEDDEIYATIEEPDLEAIGLSPQDLSQLKVSSGKKIRFKGDDYVLDEIGVTTFCKDGDEMDQENFEHWEFEGESSNLDQYLSVSRWSDGSVEVSYSVPIKSSQVTVYSIS